MAAAPRPKRVLLVHGARHGAWCWERVLAPLRALGYEPEAIDLLGHGRSTEPLTDLHGDAEVVWVRLDAIGEPTLLVGHSYGGMVITDAGTHDAGWSRSQPRRSWKGSGPASWWPPSASATTVPRCGSTAMVSPARCTETATRRPSNGRPSG